MTSKTASKGSNRNARGTSATVTDSTAERHAAEVTSRVESVRSEWNAIGTHAESVSREVARVTYAAVQAGLIGKDKPLGTMESYASTFTNPDTRKPYTKQWGMKSSRVGKALDLGMTDSEVGQVSSFYSQVGTAFDKATSLTAARKVLREAVKAGKSKSTPAKSGKRKASTDKPSAPEMPRNNKGRLDMVETLLAALTKPSAAERARLAEIRDRVSIIIGDGMELAVPQDADAA